MPTQSPQKRMNSSSFSNSGSNLLCDNYHTSVRTFYGYGPILMYPPAQYYQGPTLPLCDAESSDDETPLSLLKMKKVEWSRARQDGKIKNSKEHVINVDLSVEEKSSKTDRISSRGNKKKRAHIINSF